MKKKILITAGGTSEPIDGVRKITNMSSGALGAEIADKFLEWNFEVTYVHPKSARMPKSWSENLIDVVANSAQEVYDALEKLLTSSHYDAVIHSMAVSDYTVDYVASASAIAEAITRKVYLTVHSTLKDTQQLFTETIVNLADGSKMSSEGKISSDEEDLVIKLKKTPKIISKIKEWSPETILVGFKLLNGAATDELLRVAKALLVKNNCDYVLANDLSQIGDGKHRAMLLDGNSVVASYGHKSEIAEGLRNLITTKI